ncbi:MAG: hypothetical protein Q9165_008270 [Trypethelium subeluteriae]
MASSANDLEYLTEAEERFHFVKYQSRLREQRPPVHEGPLITLHRTWNTKPEHTWSSLPPPPPDYFTRAVQLAIKHYSSKYLENYLKGIQADECSKMLPVQHETYSDIKNIGFNLQGTTREFVVPAARKRDPTTNLYPIVVYLNGSWRPLECFLDTLHPPPEVMKDKMRRKLRGEAFWKENGGAFPFLKLPRELRDIIYVYALGPSVELREYQPYRKKKQPRVIVNDHVRVGPNIELLCCCQQICREALYILSRCVTFDFCLLGFTNHYFTKKAVPRHSTERRLRRKGIDYLDLTKIRHVRLAFSPDQFLQFFGAQLSEEKRWRLSRAAASLQNIELDSLELEIQHPYVMERCDWLKRGCHETVVSWILDAAFPYIKHLPVRLTGCVKDSVREEFSARLKTAPQFEDTYFDGDEDETIIDAIPLRGGGEKLIQRPILPVTELQVPPKSYLLDFANT